MDPQACLHRLMALWAGGYADEAREAASDLYEWLSRGGYQPQVRGPNRAGEIVPCDVVWCDPGGDGDIPYVGLIDSDGAQPWDTPITDLRSIDGSLEEPNPDRLGA